MSITSHVRRGTIQKHDGTNWVEVPDLLHIKAGDRFRYRDGYDAWRERVAKTDGEMKPHPGIRGNVLVPCVDSLYLQKRPY